MEEEGLLLSNGQWQGAGETAVRFKCQEMRNGTITAETYFFSLDIFFPAL